MRQGIEFFPQIVVFHRFFGGCFPAGFLPAVYPPFHTVFDVLRVGTNHDAARAFERFQPFYDSSQLHSVISGFGLDAAQFFVMI